MFPIYSLNKSLIPKIPEITLENIFWGKEGGTVAHDPWAAVRVANLGSQSAAYGSRRRATVGRRLLTNDWRRPPPLFMGRRLIA